MLFVLIGITHNMQLSEVISKSRGAKTEMVRNPLIE